MIKKNKTSRKYIKKERERKKTSLPMRYTEEIIQEKN